MGDEIFGFGGGGYKESWSWRSLFVEYPSLFLKKNLNAPRPSEHPPVRGKNCCDKRRETSFTVPTESGRNGKRRHVAVCTRISSQGYVYDK